MQSELGQNFDTVGLRGKIVSRSDTSVFVRFETGEFLNVVLGCEGEAECIVTLSAPMWMANEKTVERVHEDLVLKLGLDPDIECQINVCLPIDLQQREVVIAQAVPPPSWNAQAQSWTPRLPRDPKPWYKFASSTNEEVYSVPRRYDLASMMVISFAYAILFTILQSLRMEITAAFLIGAYFAVVGASQAILFKGDAPRESSIISGGACAVSFIILYSFIARFRGPVGPYAIWAIIWGPFAGYFAGTMIGGIWLIADYIRPWLDRRHDESGHNHALPSQLGNQNNEGGK